MSALLALCLMAAVPEADDLREAVRSGLRNSGTLAFTEASTTERAEVVRQLLEVYGRLQSDETLPRGERENSRIAIRSRLLKAHEILAQQFGAFPPGQQGQQGGANNAQPKDHSRELIDLIQATIAPQSWDTQGGPGTIAYWPLGHALVIRQTGDVHRALGGLFGGLRRN